MQRLFVSDLIGDDYTNWKGGDNVLISTLTGSGKTTFVFEKLLPFAAEHKKHIVYLCNRKSLNAQITRIVEESFKAKVKEELREYIHIRTYQHCEVVKDYPDIKKLDEDNKIVTFKVAVSYGCEITKYVNDVTEKDVLYYVFDEAHYFLADSCFNDRSDYWFEKIDIEQPKNSIKIFLTATPEPLYLFLSSKKIGGRLSFDFRPFFGIPKLYRFWPMYKLANSTDEKARGRWGGELDESIRFFHDQIVCINHLINTNEIMPYECNDKCRYYQEQINLRANELYDQVKDNPFGELFNSISHIYDDRDNVFTKCYLSESSLAAWYAYLNEYYFDDEEEMSHYICKDIKDNHSKWLIFVSSKRDGEKIKGIIDASGSKAVFLTSSHTRSFSGKINKKSSEEHEQLYSLIEDESFTCDVLIATSVLDCGINISSEDISNIVICQPDKTSFLQMLGRLRINSESSINLYIKAYTNVYISQRLRQSIDDFIFLYKIIYRKEDNMDIPRYKNKTGELFTNHHIRDNQISKLPSELKKSNRINYVSVKRKDPYNHPEETPRSLMEFEGRKTALLKLLSDIYEIFVARDNCTVTTPLEPYYLKRQLSWLGKTYSRDKWIGYSYAFDELYSYLEGLYQNENIIKKEYRDTFCDICEENCKKMHIDFKRYFDSFERTSESQRLSKPKKMNIIFHDIGMPFYIDEFQRSLSKKNISRERCWRIKKLPEE